MMIQSSLEQAKKKKEEHNNQHDELNENELIIFSPTAVQTRKNETISILNFFHEEISKLVLYLT